MSGTTVRLRDIGATYTGLTGKSKVDFGRGAASFVTFLEVISGPRLHGRCLESVSVAKGERQNPVVRDDLLFNGSSETPEEVALSAVVDFDPAPDTYLNSFCFGYRLKHSDAADPTYLAYFFRSSAGRQLVSSLAQGSTRYNIAKTKFLDVSVALPSIDRQREIVVALTDSDDLISTVGRAIAKKQAMQQGMMQELLTGRIRLPGFNEPWSEVRLGDHAAYVKTVALSRAQLVDDAPLRYLHYGDIHTSDQVTLGAAEAAMPRVSTLLSGNAGRLQIGDLVFADASEDPDGVGRSVEITSVPREGVVAGLHTIAARFDKSMLADGFKAYLQFVPVFRTSLLRLVAGTKVLATTRSQISSIELALPEVSEQIAIARALHDAEVEIRVLRRRVAKATAINQGMVQELLPGRNHLASEDGAV